MHILHNCVVAQIHEFCIRMGRLAYRLFMLRGCVKASVRSSHTASIVGIIVKQCVFNVVK